MSIALADLIGSQERVWRWQGRAACKGAGTAIFFPEVGRPVTEAKRYCIRCPVRTPCLISALVNREWWGYFGGTAEKDRRPLIRQLNDGVPPAEIECPFLGHPCRDCVAAKRRGCVICKRWNARIVSAYQVAMQRSDALAAA